jgi:hypothetical protein
MVAEAVEVLAGTFADKNGPQNEQERDRPQHGQNSDAIAPEGAQVAPRKSHRAGPQVSENQIRNFQFLILNALLSFNPHPL